MTSEISILKLLERVGTTYDKIRFYFLFFAKFNSIQERGNVHAFDVDKET